MFPLKHFNELKACFPDRNFPTELSFSEAEAETLVKLGSRVQQNHQTGCK